MDLKLFFEPIELECDTEGHSFKAAIYSNIHKMPDHDGLDIALIGLEEYRGEVGETDNFASANAIRGELYSLTKGSGDYGIIDLGNLRRNP